MPAWIAAAARQRPGRKNYSSAGIGSLSNFASEQLKAALGLDVVHVPYAGAAPAMRAMLAGEVDFYFAAANDAVPRMQQGPVRALLVTLPRRWQSERPSAVNVKNTLTFCSRHWRASAWSRVRSRMSTTEGEWWVFTVDLEHSSRTDLRRQPNIDPGLGMSPTPIG